MEPLSVSVVEAGRLLSISPRTVRRYILRRRLPAIRIGRRLLVPLDSLRKLVQEERNG